MSAAFLTLPFDLLPDEALLRDYHGRLTDAQVGAATWHTHLSPADHPEARDHLIRVLLTLGHDLTWARDTGAGGTLSPLQSAAVLAASARRVATGMEPLCAHKRLDWFDEDPARNERLLSKGFLLAKGDGSIVVPLPGGERAEVTP